MFSSRWWAYTRQCSVCHSSVRPAAVDTASGVEKAPGKKDAAAVAAFVQAARVAFAEIAPA